MAGSLGVDLFFVLSGFLITYILLKELRKYGDIDFELFLKNRFCRIWPMVVVITLIFMLLAADDPGGKPENELTKLLFFNNFFPKEIDHMWSVACEFQFYFVSPLIVVQMVRADKPWVLPISITVFSLICNYVLVYFTCPEIVNDIDWEKNCMIDVYYWQYAKVYCRVSPYLAGMCAALYHSRKQKAKLSPKIEWVAFGVMLIISFFGHSLPKSLNSPVLEFHYYCTHKIIFGICVAYLLTCTLSVKPDESLGNRPSACLRSCFSANCWVPMATLSYSFYVLFLPIMLLLYSSIQYWSEADPFITGFATSSVAANGKSSDIKWEFECATITGEDGLPTKMTPVEAFKRWTLLILISFVMTGLSAACCYCCVEKPGIDARVVFKHKAEIELMK